MSLTLPVDFVVGKDSLQGVMGKANQEAIKAASDLAKAQAAQIKYIDGLRAKAFADEQRLRDKEVRDALAASNAVAAAAEKEAARKVAAAESAARAQTAALASFDAALGGVNAALKGVSAEELRLSDLMLRATKLHNQGALSATQYATAISSIEQRSKQVRTAINASHNAQLLAAQSTGALSAATTNLRSQLIDIYVSLQGGQNPFTVLSQQGPQIAEALAGTTGAAAAFASMLGTVATGAGIVALALGPLIALWWEYSEMQELATARAEAWNRSQDARLPLLERANASLKELSIETSGLNDSEKERAKIIAEWNAELAAANETAKAELEIAQANLDAAKISAGGYAEKKNLVKSLTATVEANNRAAAAGLLADLKLQTMAEANAAAVKLEAEQMKELAKAKKDANKETKEALRLAAEEQAFLDGIDEEIAKLDEQDLFGATASAIAEANYEVDKGIGLVERWAAKFTDAAGEAKSVADVLGEATSLMETASSPEAVLNAVAATGPWGAFIAGLIDFVKNIDESMDSFQEFHMDLMSSISTLPESIVSHLSETLIESSQAAIRAIPRFIKSLADSIGPLIQALAGAIPVIVIELVNALVRDIPRAAWAFIKAILSPGTWISAGREMVTGFGDAFREWWQRFASGEMFAGFVEAIGNAWERFSSGQLVADLIDAFIEAAKAFIERIKSFFANFGENAKSAASTAGDVAKEVFTLGQAETKSYGDTPGLVTAPPGGMLAHFMGGDVIGATRSREQFQRMAGNEPAQRDLNVSLSSNHIGFDREMARALRQPRRATELHGFTAARKLA